MFLQRARGKLDALRTLIERGQLKPVIEVGMGERFRHLALLFWIYLSGWITLFGAYLSVTIAQRM
jgi:hypothetical protein